MSRATVFLPVIESNALADARELYSAWCAQPSDGWLASRLVTQHRRAGVAAPLSTARVESFQRRVRRAACVALECQRATPVLAQRRSRATGVFDALAAGDIQLALSLGRSVRDTLERAAESPEDFAFTHAAFRLVEGG